MRQSIFSLLVNDPQLAESLTGGIYDAVTVNEISRQNTPGAFDANYELKPCALLKMSAATPLGPYPHSARQGFSVLFYAAPVEAGERVYDLLHNQKLTPVGATAGCWEIHWTDDVPGQIDEALSASLTISRFEAVVLRRY
jgi:hypothetical protein